MMTQLNGHATTPVNNSTTVKIASLRDILALLELAKEFIGESAWGYNYSEAKSLAKFSGYIQDPECDVLVTQANGRITGWALVAYDDEFHDERVGYIGKFYISKSYRGTSAARQLMAACSQWFDSNKCDQSFATATANIPSEGKLFENLAGKVGYQPCGQTLMRVKP